MSAPRPPTPTTGSPEPAAGMDSASSPQPGSTAAKREAEISAPAPQTPAVVLRPAVRAAPSTAQQAGSSAAPDPAASAQRAAELQVVRMWRNLADTISPASSRQTVAELKQHLLGIRDDPELYASLDDESRQWLEKALPEFESAEKAIKFMDALIDEAEDVLQPQQQPLPAPGGEFLEARLRRCAALPPAQRGPDEAAFLESAQLCREVCELLPLAPSGRPALPSLEPDRLHLAMELALAKLWRARYICPYGCRPVSDADYVRAVDAYTHHRTHVITFQFVEAIAWGDPSRSSGSSGSRASGGGSGGSGSGTTGPHGVPVGSALRTALQVATWGLSLRGFPGARLLRAAVDIASHPACAAAIDRRLAELAASQPTHHSALRLTARQLCCACCVALAHREGSIKEVCEPKPSVMHLPAARLSAAEQEAEVRAAVQAGLARLLQLEPHSPRTLLLAAESQVLGCRHASREAVERSLQALQAGRQQGSRLHEAQAGTEAMFHTSSLLVLPDQPEEGEESSTAGSKASDAGRGSGDDEADARPEKRGSKASGRGAGAARRRQRRAAKQFQVLQQQAAAVLESAPSLPAAEVQSALEAFNRGGELLKECKRHLPEPWVRRATEVRNLMRSWVPALELLLEEAQQSSSTVVRGGQRRLEGYSEALRAARDSGSWANLQQMLDRFRFELRRMTAGARTAIYLDQGGGSTTPVCSGCGASAVGLRKCAACKRAQYCSAECQKRHWLTHRAECRPAAAGGASSSRGG